jgi:hypothetical protein
MAMPEAPKLELEAMIDFMEAVKRSRKLKKREQLSRRLELVLRKAFKEQGRLFVRGLSKLRNRFTEAAQTGHWRATIPSPFGNDKQIIVDEAMAPTEWMFIFYDVANKTFGLFEKPIDSAVQASLASGAVRQIADLGLNISFDLKNPRAVAYLEKYGAAQVTKINETTRDYLHTVLTQAISEGWSYDRTAEAIIQRYKEFQVGSPLEHIDSRAHLIAVTETGNAYTEGNLMVAQDLQDAGIEMEKAWSRASDFQDECAQNEAAGWIPINDPFPSGDMRPLAHPGCLCDLLTRVKNRGE